MSPFSNSLLVCLQSSLVKKASIKKQTADAENGSAFIEKSDNISSDFGILQLDLKRFQVALK
ncbi:hypothetical protein ACI0FM_03830 [Paenochrobactrum sp. BZR 588]|uniref:hypothetical protein n=1 Tax=Paenochrobactrum sp. BZR 588 TaxID=3378076 RepID=UPI003854F6BB